MIILGDQQELAFPNTNLITAVKLVEDPIRILEQAKQGHLEIFFAGTPQIFNIQCSSYKHAEQSYQKILDIIKEDREEMRKPVRTRSKVIKLKEKKED